MEYKLPEVIKFQISKTQGFSGSRRLIKHLTDYKHPVKIKQEKLTKSQYKKNETQFPKATNAFRSVEKTTKSKDNTGNLATPLRVCNSPHAKMKEEQTFSKNTTHITRKAHIDFKTTLKPVTITKKVCTAVKIVNLYDIP